MGVCCCISLCRRKIHSMVATPATVKVTIILLFFFFRIRFKQSCKVDSCVYESIRFYSPAVSYYRLNRISISIVSIRYSFQFHEKKNKILNESKGKLINLTLFFFLYFMCAVFIRYLLELFFQIRDIHPHHLLGRRELLVNPAKRVISYQ